MKLPNDVGIPVILKDKVFFPGTVGNLAVVVDRATWKVIARPALAHNGGFGQSASDGKTLYVPSGASDSVMTVSETDFSPKGSILPVHVFSVAVSDNRLWVGGSTLDLVQRFALAK